MTARRKSRNGKHHSGGSWCSRRIRLAIFLRDRGTCLYCLADLHGSDPRDVTIDHVVPRSAGGGNESGNLVLCCRSCNCKKQDLSLVRFAGPEARAHIRRNVKRSMARYLKLADALLSGRTGAGSD